MKPVGSKNIEIDGYPSVRKYVLTQYFLGKYPKEVMKELEMFGIEHKKAKGMVFVYRRHYRKSLSRE